jgi:hypothetical protein
VPRSSTLIGTAPDAARYSAARVLVLMGVLIALPSSRQKTEGGGRLLYEQKHTGWMASFRGFLRAGRVDHCCDLHPHIPAGTTNQPDIEVHVSALIVPIREQIILIRLATAHRRIP